MNVVALLVACILLVGPAWSTLYSQLSSFERNTVDEGLALYGLKPQDQPSGKTIATIYIFTKEPFAPEAGILALLDHLHVNTKEGIIRRDLFIKPGELYDPVAIQDSELVLRKASEVRSMAVIVPVSTNNAHEISLLVATRDILSLRPSFSFSASGWSLKNLEMSLSLAENNLLGYNKSVTAGYELKQAMHIISAKYFDPRLFGSRFQLKVRPGLVFARDSFKVDGFLGEFELKKPLISLTEKWGYGIEMELGANPVIDFNGGSVRPYKIPFSMRNETVEHRYRWSHAEGKIHVRRSFGTIYKKEVFASYDLNIKRPSIPDDLNLPQSARADFARDVLPKNELESYISLGMVYFENRFLTLYDYNNFKLQEVKKLGPQVKISNDFSSQPLLFSDHNFLRPQLSLAFVQALGLDSFVSLSASASTRYDGDWTDDTFKFGLGVVSPKWLNSARVIFDSHMAMALKNRDNQKYKLGSDKGLRGVNSGFYSGNKVFRTNLELRSTPLDVWIFHAGLVFFYDVGSAFDGWPKANATHTLGLGLRVLMPQVSSELFRLDFGFPIYGIGTREHVAVPSLGLGQAF